jgi:hypothetical protein
MLSESPPENKAKFVGSVKWQIEQNPFIYPSVAQVEILKNIQLHIEHKKMSDVELQVREMMGV